VWRLSRDAIAKGLRGEKAIAGFDEDSITMAVAAAMDCLNGIDRQGIDGLFFATTTSPYKEKLGAAIVATAVDLRRGIYTADFSNCLRAGTTALRAAVDAVKSGSARQVLVVASDCRLGMPGSTWEINCGDGAAAFLIGSSGVVAEIEGLYSVYEEIIDIWRSDEDRFIRSWEARFVATEGYMALAGEAIKGLIKSLNFSRDDFDKAVFGLPDAKAQATLAKKNGFDVKSQLQDSLFSSMGDTGAAYSLMLLRAALEGAGGNDRLLLLSYGNGCDAMSVRVSGPLTALEKNRGIKGFLGSKKVIRDYKTYAKWRGLLPVEAPARTVGFASPPAIWREVEGNIRFRGVRCNVCGTIQYPPQVVCTKCHGRGQFESVRLSDKRANLYTYAVDYTYWVPDVTYVTAIVNFEGGGRTECPMADVEEREIEMNMPVEMSFRRLDYRKEEGICVYSWKCTPVR